MTEKRLAQLIVRRMSGELTETEGIELERWAATETSNRAFLDRVTDEKRLERELSLWKSIDPNKAYAEWATGTGGRKKGRLRRVLGWSAAAAIIVSVSVIGLIGRKTAPSSTVANIVKPVLPGRNTATLTLSNGRQILLDSVGNGELATQGSAQLTKTDSKSISYSVSDRQNIEDIVYNILNTPRAGQYQLVLPDGTHVWLNNLSSIRYPTTFSGKDRTVELSGEAYFEIAKDAAKPFFVKVKGGTVEVLGTSFNVTAYEEENNVRTTLISGAVRVEAGQVSVQLKPDEQASFSGTNGLKVIKGVPSQDIISWKNGFFYFGRASLPEVMSQLARWYDVDIVYQGKVPDFEFAGKIDRNIPLNELLSFFDKNQVHFHLEGRKIIVLP